MSHEKHMRRAIALSRERMRQDEGGPFGAVIVRDGAVIAEGWNRVIGQKDPTAHAEIEAIRAACRTLGTFTLAGCVIYTSCEPCPMCLAAIWWARIDRVYYANTAEDAGAIGFDDETLYREIMMPREVRSPPLVRLLADEALEVFREWAADPGKVRY